MTDEQARLEVTIDPRLVPIIGRSQYSGHPLMIVTRELLQNARDAQKRQKTEKRIRIVIRWTGWSGNGASVMVRDHGDGMTPDVIKNKFFKLGATTKLENGDAVGGFGIAAASILANDEWQIYTNDRAFTSEDYLAGGFTRTKKFLQGTIVYVKIKEQTYSSALKSALRMIYWSDVDVDLYVYREGKIILRDPHAGLKSLKLNMVDGEESTEVCSYKITGPAMIGDTNWGFEEKGVDTVRLGGLVQFVLTGGGRETNLIFDIKPKHKPGDPDYELSASREKLRGDVESFFVFRTAAHSTNAQQSLKKVMEPEAEQDTRLTPGHLEHGTREVRFKPFWLEIETHGGRDVVKIEQAEITPEGNLLCTDSTGRKWLYQGDVDEVQKDIVDGNILLYADFGKLAEKLGFTGSASLMTEIKVRADNHRKKREKAGISFFNKNYTVDADDLPLHTVIVELWHEMLKALAPTTENFGIGVMRSSYAAAERNGSTGNVHYLINPYAVVRIGKDPEGMVTYLWSSVCHEITHIKVNDHTENFLIDMEKHLADSAHIFMQNFKKWVRRLEPWR